MTTLAQQYPKEYAEGYDVGRAFKEANNPYPKESDQYLAWDAGWVDGLDWWERE